MRESGYFPAGAEFDPLAPYNEPIIPDKEFDVVCSQTLSKGFTITTNDYQPVFDEEDGHTYANTEDTDWYKAFGNSGGYTPLELVAILKEYLERDLKSWEESPKGEKYPHKKYLEVRRLKKLIESCKDWTEDDIEIVED